MSEKKVLQVNINTAENVTCFEYKFPTNEAEIVKILELVDLIFGYDCKNHTPS